MKNPTYGIRKSGFKGGRRKWQIIYDARLLRVSQLVKLSNIVA